MLPFVDATPFSAHVRWLTAAGWHADLVAVACDLPIDGIRALAGTHPSPRLARAHAVRLLACTPTWLQEHGQRAAPPSMVSALRSQLRQLGHGTRLRTRNVTYSLMWRWQRECADAGLPYLAVDLEWVPRARLAA